MQRITTTANAVIRKLKSMFPLYTLPSMASEGGARTGINSSPIPSPFVEYNGETVAIFTYGWSDYGGEDLLVEHDIENERTSKRYFLYLS